MDCHSQVKKTPPLIYLSYFDLQFNPVRISKYRNTRSYRYMDIIIELQKEWNGIILYT